MANEIANVHDKYMIQFIEKGFLSKYAMENNTKDNLGNTN